MKPRLLLLLTGSMAAPPVAWFAAQQATGSLTYFACQAAAPPLGLAIGLLGFAACLAAGAICFRYRTAPTPFAAHLGLGLAAIFGLANLFTLAAVWLIPPCAR